MTTSRNTDFESTGERIVSNAFSHLLVKQKGQNIQADDMEFGKDQLNSLIKTLQADGLHLWKDKKAAVFLQLNRRIYTVGDQNTLVCTPGEDGVVDNFVYATGDDWVGTSTTSALTAGDSVIPIASLLSYNGVPFNSTCSNKIGIQNVDGDLEWFTVLSISALDVTIDGVLSEDVNDSGAVFIYRHDLGKPLKVYQEGVRLFQSSGSYEQPVHHQAWSDYDILPQKNTVGVVVQAAFQPKVGNMDIAIWPTTNTTANVLLFRYQAEIDIFSNTSSQDFPNEWILPLEWMLADQLAPSFSVSPQRQVIIAARADAAHEKVLDWDQDNSSIYLQPTIWPQQ